MQSYDMRNAAGSHLDASEDESATKAELAGIRRYLAMLMLKRFFPHIWLCLTVFLIIGLYYAEPRYSIYFLFAAAASCVIGFLFFAKETAGG